MAGDHELAIILNQLVFFSSSMPWLSVAAVRKYTLSKRNHTTVRNKLKRLIELGLVERKPTGRLYNAHLYRAKTDIISKEMKIAAMVEGRDMRFVDTYTEAELINKLRFFANEGELTVKYSARELTELISSDRCSETIRCKIKNLMQLKYIIPRLVGRMYEYELDLERLLNGASADAVNEEGDRLTELFKKHSEVHLNTIPAPLTIASWKQTFKGMLASGYNYDDISRIIAYLPQSAFLGIYKSPSALKRNFAVINESAQKLSKRKVKGYLAKLLKSKPVSAAALAEVNTLETTKEILPDKEAEAAYIEEWLAELYKVKTNRGNWFEFWADKLQINTNGFDEDEVKSLAQLHMLKYYRNYVKGIKRKPSISRNSYLIYAIRREVENNFRAQDEYKRALFENIGGEDVFGEERSIEDFGDVKIEEFVQLHLAEDVKLRDAIFSALKQLSDDRERGVIIAYHGLNGVKLSQKEIAEKYNCSYSWINKILHRVYNKLDKLLIKDDEVRKRLRLKANAPP